MSDEPGPDALEPALGGERLRHAPPGEPLELVSPSADRLEAIPERRTGWLSTFEDRLTDVMAIVLVGMVFLAIVAAGLALIATIVRYTWDTLHHL